MALERLLAATAGLATPALVVDPVAADHNIAAAGVRLRPHFKAHKCPELMRRQLAGATAPVRGRRSRRRGPMSSA